MPEGTPVGATPTSTSVEPAAKAADTDKPLGPNGEKALQAERDARKQLESQLTAITQRLNALAGATDGAKPDDPVAALNNRLSSLERNLQVASVARDNGITDPGDIRLLESATDDETLNLLVARLKATAPQPDNSKLPAPRPDLTQGGSGNSLALNGDGIEAALKAKLGIA